MDLLSRSDKPQHKSSCFSLWRSEVMDMYNHTGKLICISNIYKKAPTSQHKQDQTQILLSPILATCSLPEHVKVYFLLTFLPSTLWYFETWVWSQMNLFPSGLLGSRMANQWVFVFYFWNLYVLCHLSQMKLNLPGCCDSLLPFGVLLIAIYRFFPRLIHSSLGFLCSCSYYLIYPYSGFGWFSD